MSQRQLCNTLFLLLVSAITLVWAPADAQKIDSLKTVLRAHPQQDTTRVNLLWKLANAYENNSTDSMIAFANEGIAIADKINFTIGRASCIQMLGLAYLHLNEHDKALNYYRTALTVFEKNGIRKKEGNILLSMGDIYYRLSQYDTAMAYYNKGIAIYKEMNNAMGQGFALISIGGIYNDQSDYANAIDYYLQALKAFEKDNYTPGVCMSLTTIATVYSSLGDNKKALEYINRSLQIDDSKSNKEQQALDLNNIAQVYESMKDYDNALLYYNKGMAMAESIGDDAWRANMLLNIGNMQYLTKRYDSAMQVYQRTLHMAEKIRDTLSYIGASRGIGRIMIQMGDTRGGIARLLPVYELMQRQHMKQIAFETALDLSEAYEHEGDYAKALQFHKEYTSTGDSLFNSQKEKNIQRLQFDYELGKKENQIELLKKDHDIATAQSDRQKTITVSLIIGLALLIAIIIILNRSREYEKHSKEKILHQKEEIEKQAKELEELNAFKDKTFSVLAHDLRSPLNSLAATVELLSSNIISPEEFSKLRPELNTQLGSLNILMDNLLNWAKNYIQGKTPAKPAHVNLYETTVRNIKLLRDMADSKQITLANNLAPNTSAFCDPGQIDIVIRNLLSNAIKFNNPGGMVNISSETTDSKVRLTIADNGIGMAPEQLKKIFTASIGNSTPGTEGEKGIGLGLVMCNEFVAANGGIIIVTSAAGKGTTFVVELPTSVNPIDVMEVA